MKGFTKKLAYRIFANGTLRTKDYIYRDTGGAIWRQELWAWKAGLDDYIVWVLEGDKYLEWKCGIYE